MRKNLIIGLIVLLLGFGFYIIILTKVNFVISSDPPPVISSDPLPVISSDPLPVISSDPPPVISSECEARIEKSQNISFDFNRDGFDENIELKDSKVTVFYNNEKIFTTDPSWDAEQILTGDFNNDGSTDLAIYLWKTGNYGEDMPFWIEENDNSYKQHLFLYEWDFEKNKLKALWHSSNLPFNNIQTTIEDINNDGENELVVIERPYEWGPGDTGQNTAVWKWDEWGFSLVERNLL